MKKGDAKAKTLTQRSFGNDPEKASLLHSPLYSRDTQGSDSTDNMGPVSGPKKGKVTPDPLGYCHGRK
jgi:hypothetical protein